jgi:hypothetical protein
MGEAILAYKAPIVGGDDQTRLKRMNASCFIINRMICLSCC